jgi:hypothetical protein
MDKPNGTSVNTDGTSFLVGRRHRTPPPVHRRVVEAGVEHSGCSEASRELEAPCCQGSLSHRPNGLGAMAEGAMPGLGGWPPRGTAANLTLSRPQTEPKRVAGGFGPRTPGFGSNPGSQGANQALPGVRGPGPGVRSPSLRHPAQNFPAKGLKYMGERSCGRETRGHPWNTQASTSHKRDCQVCIPTQEGDVIEQRICTRGVV